MALPKLYEQITWVNDTTPALNEDNLNAMSQALEDIDNRVIDVSSTVMETVPELEEMIEEVEQITQNPPYIGDNGDWYVWDTATSQYVDSGVDASITITVGTTSTLSPGSSATVTNTGTSTDPIFNFGIPQGVAGTPGTDGQDGQDGTDGVSPTVTITTITGGHRVTITDAEHPGGQSFDVMDGSGGDMQASVYDPLGTVATAGGIVAYINDVITDALTASY